MRKHAIALSAALLSAFASAAALTSEAKDMQDYPYEPVPFTDVHLIGGFWEPRIETNRTVTIPFAFQQCEKNNRMYNFERAAMALRGETVADIKQTEFPFDDTDVYKVIEGASYAMAVKPDPAMDAYVDKLIVGIAAAQEPDGYLYTTRTLSPAHPHPWAGATRWVNERELSHELYNLGHLYEAAVAHFQSTGKRSLLNIAIKSADLLDATFGAGKQTIWPGHQIVEMGLVKLYRVTGDERYLKLAKFFLDVRGPDGHAGSGRDDNQSQAPVVQQTEAVGHAVRAVYMYSGMADVAALTGDQSYVHAIDTIWENCVGKKLYITGGIGSTEHGEAFGKNYELPNMSAYNETCAAIGNVYWNQRLFLLHGDAKYIDVLERTLYNGLIDGVSLDGCKFFYPNPLESNGQHQRQPWFGCACCPSNICRFMASVPGYVYAQRGDHLYINLFAAGEARITLKNQAVRIDQSTQYPWSGDVSIKISPEAAADFTVCVRIPGWARNQPVPSDLYAFAEPSTDSPTLTVNGHAVPIDIDAGYVKLQRTWTAGDTIALHLPMPVRRVVANEKVEADRGRIALERGPIVFCAEWPDNASPVRTMVLPDDAAITIENHPETLGGILTLKATAQSYAKDGSHSLAVLTAIPYYAWAHRGPGQMQVWFARDPAALAEQQAPAMLLQPIHDPAMAPPAAVR